MKMNLGLIKSGVQLLTGFGVGIIADHGIELIKPTNLKGLKKIAVKVGGFVLSAMVADKATSYVEEVWNDTAKGIKDLMTPEEVTEEEVEAK
jgi:hypothetical protein